MKFPPVQYHDYLKLDSLLSSQVLRSVELGQPAHDELLFITVHQTYELWFKQILCEVDSIHKMLSQDSLPENELTVIVPRLERVVDILKFIIGQIDILETMTPLDFLDFRDMLFPASGFQSFQFRQLETVLGLRQEQRLNYTDSTFVDHLKAEQRSEILALLNRPSLFQLVEKWLERTPFVKSGSYEFWSNYKKAVEDFFQGDMDFVRKNPRLKDEEKQKTLALLEMALKNFSVLFTGPFKRDPELQGQEAWPFQFSQKAMLSALFINIYRDRPLLNLPYRLLAALMDIDEAMTMWRYRHSQMALRMLGRKIGTGGSSGHDYLKATTDKHRVFQDLFLLTTFLIPRNNTPQLPKEIEELLTAKF